MSMNNAQSKCQNTIKPTIDIINTAWQSREERLFAGTTPKLRFGCDTNSWAQLYNPKDSTINLYLTFISITNFSNFAYSCDWFINSNPPGKRSVVPELGNLNFGSSNKPQGKILYNPSVIGSPEGGVRIAARRISANSTLAGFRIDGRAIITPGTSFLFFCSSDRIVEGEIEFEWFENTDIF